MLLNHILYKLILQVISVKKKISVT